MEEKKLDKDINVRSKELTDEEIVKALECCASRKSCIGYECCLYSGQHTACVEMGIDLIHRSQDEIERLTEYCGMFERGEIGSPMTTDKMLALEKEKIELQKLNNLANSVHFCTYQWYGRTPTNEEVECYNKKVKAYNDYWEYIRKKYGAEVKNGKNQS